MPNDSAFPKSLMAAALSAAFPGIAVAQTAARIDFATGNVTASTADGRSRALTRGSDLQVGETVNTQQGRAQMRFTDGAFVSLQPQTEFKIENYVFEGRGSPKESAVMNLLKGGMRTITGLIGRTNRDGYRLQTATATVGTPRTWSRWACVSQIATGFAPVAATLCRISPVSSSKPMNLNGGTRPSSELCQRISASTPTIARRSRSTLG